MSLFDAILDVVLPPSPEVTRLREQSERLDREYKEQWNTNYPERASRGELPSR